jgi:6-phosphogluconolactonase
MSKTVYYASVGPVLTLYDIDFAAGSLAARSTVTLPANIQYVWRHLSRHTLYVVSSNGGPGLVGDKHFATALAIDPASGALRPQGEAAPLPSRPIHCSVDRSGKFLLTAYNNPSNVTVHRINVDGTLGAPVKQSGTLDTGIYAHQILAMPDNRAVVLVTRGNNAGGGKLEDPGALKTFAFNDGVLSNLASIAPGNGLGFGPRHLDFHRPNPGPMSRSSGRTSFTSTSSTQRPGLLAIRPSSRRPWSIRRRRFIRAPARSMSIPTANLST